jgi:Holliday junction DNA helicase RuvB
METQKTSEEVVYAATLQALSSDPTGEIERLLQDMLQWEREHPPQNTWDGFEWYMVHGDARTLNSLVTKRILSVRLKTNKTCNYRLSNINAVERALSNYQEMATPQEETAEIPPDLFDIIIGHDDKKDIIMRSIGSDRPVHCLLHGSIASAKTLMLEELARLPRSKLVLGSNLSRAGLFELLFSERPKYLIVDELEKVDDENNLAALLSLMERGLLTETKYMRYRRLQLKTWVFASANRIDRIWPELLSRFSAKLRFRDYTDNEFLEVVVNVLTAREGLTESISAYIADVTLKDLNSRDVRNAIGVSRLLKTKDKEEVDHVVSILSRQR